MHQTENSNPILSCQGKKLTRNTPRRPGTKYIIPTHAMLFGTRDTIVTPVKITTISTTPLTQPRSVVCRGLKPKDKIRSWSWLVSEFEMSYMAANNAKSHVFGSVKASINCSFLKCLFSTPVWFSFVSYSTQAYNSSYDYILWYVERPLPSRPRSKTKRWPGSLGTGNCIFPWKNGLRDGKDAHKNDSAMMRVSTPVMIINLEKRKCIGEVLNLIVPLPPLKRSGVYV